jgi:hypothetical protein
MNHNRVPVYKIKSNWTPVYKIKSNQTPVYKIKSDQVPAKSNQVLGKRSSDEGAPVRFSGEVLRRGCSDEGAPGRRQRDARRGWPWTRLPVAADPCIEEAGRGAGRGSGAQHRGALQISAGAAQIEAGSAQIPGEREARDSKREGLGENDAAGQRPLRGTRVRGRGGGLLGRVQPCRLEKLESSFSLGQG